MRILVTGANGYLGQGIVKKLLDAGNEVIATDISTVFVDERATLKECNLFEIENPYDYFEKPDVLLHLAWRDGFKHFSNSHINDLPKHMDFISNICDSEIKKISVLGTMHEIGFYEGCIDENTACNPGTYYGIAKNALRKITEILCIEKNKKFQWLRGFYIVGNSKFGFSIFSKIMSAVENGVDIFPFTTGVNQFDFLDYDDFCSQVLAVVSQDKINGVINICSGKPQKLSERVEKFIEENLYNIKLDYGAYPDRLYDSKAVWGNNAKIQKILKI